MSEWWQVLLVAFSGGVIGGTVAYRLEMKSRRDADQREKINK